MDLVIKIRSIVGNDKERRQRIVSSCPQCRAPLQKVSVAVHADDASSTIFKGERHTDCYTRTGAQTTTTTIVAEIVERIVPVVRATRPTLREVRQGELAVTTEFSENDLDITRN